MPTNIYLVDDHPVVLQAITEWIAHIPDVTVCGTASTAQVALTQIPQIMPDLVITDLSLPDMSGLTLTKQLLQLLPSLLVLVLSARQESFVINRVLAAGASGYILKQKPLEIQTAITHVLDGGVYISPALQYNQKM